jgi:hypothetical protein
VPYTGGGGGGTFWAGTGGVGDEDASPVGEVEEAAEAEDPVEEEAEDNIEARGGESEEPAEEPVPASLPEALPPEEGKAETVGSSPVSPTFCCAVGTPLTSPPPWASFLGLVPTKKANIKSPPTRTKIRRPIFRLSGTLLP